MPLDYHERIRLIADAGKNLPGYLRADTPVQGLKYAWKAGLAGLASVVAGFRLPYRVLASICVPAGRIVVAFVSDSARLSGMFAANWAQRGPMPSRTPRCMRRLLGRTLMTL